MNVLKNQLLNTYALLIQYLCNKAKYHQISAGIKKTASMFHKIIPVSHNQTTPIINALTAVPVNAIISLRSWISLLSSSFEQLKDTSESVWTRAKLIYKSAISRPTTVRDVCVLPATIDYPDPKCLCIAYAMPMHLRLDL